MAGAGVLAGAAFGLLLARVAGSCFGDLKMPGALPVIVSAFVLLGAAVVASMLPAARAARVDVIQALRSEFPGGGRPLQHGQATAFRFLGVPAAGAPRHAGRACHSASP